MGDGNRFAQCGPPSESTKLTSPGGRAANEENKPNTRYGIRDLGHHDELCDGSERRSIHGVFRRSLPHQSARGHSGTGEGSRRNVEFEDAQGDIGKQLSQIQNFIAKKVDVIVVNPVDSSATAQMTRLIKEAGIPWSMSTSRPSKN